MFLAFNRIELTRFQVNVKLHAWIKSLLASRGVELSDVRDGVHVIVLRHLAVSPGRVIHIARGEYSFNTALQPADSVALIGEPGVVFTGNQVFRVCSSELDTDKYILARQLLFRVPDKDRTVVSDDEKVEAMTAIYQVEDPNLRGGNGSFYAPASAASSPLTLL